LSRYTSITDDDLAEMLAEIGIDSIDELFADVPDELRLSGPLDTDDGLSEQEVYGQLRSLAQRNISADDEVTFLGAGMYDHYVPALIDSIISRSEFLTPYTPCSPPWETSGCRRCSSIRRRSAS
jgi:glycine dehydrogenase subunit 1